MKAGTCAYVDAGEMSSYLDPGRTDLFQRIISRVESALQAFRAEHDRATGPPPMILIDDLSSLLWSSGGNPAELAAFYRHILSLATHHNATVISLFHSDACFPNMPEAASIPDESSDMALKHLIRLSHLWITTRSLRAQMMGEVGEHCLCLKICLKSMCPR